MWSGPLFVSLYNVPTLCFKNRPFIKMIMFMKNKLIPLNSITWCLSKNNVVWPICHLEIVQLLIYFLCPNFAKLGFDFIINSVPNRHRKFSEKQAYVGCNQKFMVFVGCGPTININCGLILVLVSRSKILIAWPDSLPCRTCIIIMQNVLKRITQG